MNLVLAFGMPGPLELGIILVIVLLVFGAGKLPKIATQLGSTFRNFKKGAAGIEDEIVEVKAAIEAPVKIEKPAVKEQVVEVSESEEVEV